MTASPTPPLSDERLAKAMSAAIFVPVRQTIVKNWHAPLPEGEFYATPQECVLELIRAAVEVRDELAELRRQLREAGEALECGAKAIEYIGTEYAYRYDDISGKNHDKVCECRDHAATLRALRGLVRT